MFILADTVCGGLLPVVRLLRQAVFPIFQIGIPIILIIMGSLDLGKAVLASDDKEIKAATGRLVKRLVAAVAVFFIVTIVTLVIGWATEYSRDDTSKSGPNAGNDLDWAACWKAAGERK